MDYTTANFCAVNGPEEPVNSLSNELISKLTHLTNLSVQKKHP